MCPHPRLFEFDLLSHTPTSILAGHRSRPLGYGNGNTPSSMAANMSGHGSAANLPTPLFSQDAEEQGMYASPAGVKEQENCTLRRYGGADRGALARATS